jgi:hypothetical protein
VKTAVVLQPQYLPWRGVFEQIRLADVYVHFDDVQFPQGRSFTSRVQVKTGDGPRWLTVPIVREGRVTIAKTRIDESRDWRSEHLRTLEHAYARAPYRDEMMQLARKILLEERSGSLNELAIRGVECISGALGLNVVFRRSSANPSAASATERLVEICLLQGADRYVTGLGALRYLDESLFLRAGIEVQVMDYTLRAYSQQHGEFTPYVSMLDVIANLGFTGALSALDSPAIAWNEARAKANIA